MSTTPPLENLLGGCLCCILQKSQGFAIIFLITRIIYLFLDIDNSQYSQFDQRLVNNVSYDNKHILHGISLNIKFRSPKVSNIQRREAELNIISPRENKLDIQRKSMKYLLY